MNYLAMYSYFLNCSQVYVLVLTLKYQRCAKSENWPRGYWAILAEV